MCLGFIQPVSHRAAFWLAALVLICPMVWADAPAEGLRAHWPLDSLTHNIATDVGPYGLDAQSIRGYIARRGDVSAAACNGYDAWIECPDYPALDIHNAITVSVWAWPDGVPVNEAALAGTTYCSYLLSYYSNGQAYWYIGGGGNNLTARLTCGRWTHLVGTFDGTTMGLYMDGQQVATKASSVSYIPSGGTFRMAASPVLCGSSLIDPHRDKLYKGKLAHVRVYDRALSAEQVQQLYQADVNEHILPAGPEFRPISPVVTIQDTGLAVDIGDGGGVQIRYNGSRCLLDGRWSYPGSCIGFNSFDEHPEYTGQQSWQPSVEQLSATTARISASGDHVRVERTLSLQDGWLLVEDHLTNLTDQPVGSLTRNRLRFSQPVGTPDVGASSAAAYVFVRQPSCRVAMVAEDVVSRAHFASFGDDYEAGYRVDHFALAADAGYTMSFRVKMYDSQAGLYDMFNEVRREWGVNHTLQGPFEFFDAADPLLQDPAALEAYLTRKKIGIAALAPWLDYDPQLTDHVLTRSEYTALIQPAMNAIKAASPGIRVIGCVETDWITVDPVDFEGGDTWPDCGSSSADWHLLSLEQSQSIADSGLPWADSVVEYTAAGNYRLEVYERGGSCYYALNVIPAVGNYQHQFLNEQVEFLINTVGMDGFYIDEFAPFWYRSYHAWDGYTADIDPITGQIVRRYSHPAIYGHGSRLQLCQYAQDNNLVMVANTYGISRQETAYPVMRFAETWATFMPQDVTSSGTPDFMPHLMAGAFNTPIGLGANGSSVAGQEAELFYRSIINYLRHGMIYYHYWYPTLPESGQGSGEYGPINNMFPITPEIIEAGTIIGSDRVITCLSGQYVWNSVLAPHVTTYDITGRQKQSTVSMTFSNGSWQIDLQLSDFNEIAIIRP